MANHSDGVNPLRPYYIPPSIGEAPEALPAPGPRALSQAGSATGGYASKARDIFSDIDYADYIAEPSSSVVQTVRELLDELLWKYTSVLMAQPFEVAKTIMQVRLQDDLGGLGPADDARPRQASHHRIAMSDEATVVDSDSDIDDERGIRRLRCRRRPRPCSPTQLVIRTPDSVLEVIAQLWHKEGAWGVWKGTNATFLYSVLQPLLENWSRSLLSALFNVPDLGVKQDMDRLVDIASPYPWASLCVAATAAVVTGLILSPLDLVRTRLVITSTASKQTRRTLSALRSLPSYLCPAPLLLPTVLHSLVHPLLTLSAPLVLRTRFMIDRELAPATFSVAKFCSSSVALLLKLPLETVLRRGQVAVLRSEPYVRALAEPRPPSAAAGLGRRLDDGPAAELETIVPVGGFDGLFGTMYSIVSEEGSHAVAVPAATATAAAAGKAGPRKGKAGSGSANVAETVYRRGQGLDGLWRGWKVSWWGLVGLWAAGVLGGGGDGEF
ncbi:hypothetical protein VTH06DRAFT_6848 [Thermothelomyces fergusii]